MTIQKYGSGPYGSGGYKGLSIDEVDQLHYYALKKIFPVRNLEGVLDDDLTIEGRYLDQVYGPPTQLGQAQQLLSEFFGDTANLTMSDYERVYNLPSTGSLADRRTAVVTAMRSKGGLNRAYFIGLASSLGYTITIQEGVTAFVVASTHPPATLLPAPLFDPSLQWVWVVTIIGVTSAPDLVTLLNRLRPAWTLITYVYA
jgi:uncharacterized protein YmfQ (DUF2313 family)